jgi:hypothetical protein
MPKSRFYAGVPAPGHSHRLSAVQFLPPAVPTGHPPRLSALSATAIAAVAR